MELSETEIKEKEAFRKYLIAHGHDRIVLDNSEISELTNVYGCYKENDKFIVYYHDDRGVVDVLYSGKSQRAAYISLVKKLNTTYFRSILNYSEEIDAEIEAWHRWVEMKYNGEDLFICKLADDKKGKYKIVKKYGNLLVDAIEINPLSPKDNDNVESLTPLKDFIDYDNLKEIPYYILSDFLMRLKRSDDLKKHKYR